MIYYPRTMYLYATIYLLGVTLLVAAATIPQQDLPNGSVEPRITKRWIKFYSKGIQSGRGLTRHQRNKAKAGQGSYDARKGFPTGQQSNSLPEDLRKLSEDIYLQSVNISSLDTLEALLVDRLQVRVAAVAESVEVLVDDVAVYSMPAKKSSGFHVLALSPWDGRMLLKRHFYTGQLGDGVLMRSCLASLQPGTLVVLIPMFNAGNSLGTTEKFLLEKLGMEGYGVGGAVESGPTSYLEELGGSVKPNPTSHVEGVGGAAKMSQVNNIGGFLGTYHKDSDFKGNDNAISTDEDSARKRRKKEITHKIWISGEKNSLQYPASSRTVNKKSNSYSRSSAMEQKHSRFKKGYIQSKDPSVLVSLVPQGWPPEQIDESLTRQVYAETAIISIGNGSTKRNLEIVASIRRHRGQRCPWHDDPARAAQLQFCSLYEGYGALCRCQDPIIPERLRRAAPPIAMTESIPVAMLTATKSYFFYRQLVNLLTTAGAAQTSILVLIDGYHKETAQLAALFGLPTIIHTHEGASGTSTPLNAHFRFSVHTAFSIFPNVSKIIILEDDLLLSPDFLRYFQQTAWLLDADPSLYCVNSFSLNSYATVASDVGRLRRSELYPQFGWMVTRKWAEELLHVWVSKRREYLDWDWWLAHAARRRNRHAIVPEVSRSLHSGSSGAHVTGFMQATLFSTMIYNQDPNAKLRDLDT